LTSLKENGTAVTGGDRARIIAMLTRALFALAFALLPAALVAQSPAEAAEREKQRRQKQKSSPAPTYTNDDLPKSGAASPSPAKPASPQPRGEGDQGSSSQGQQDEAAWRARARQARAEIRTADTRIETIQKRLNALLVDTSPTNVGDPFRLQTLEAERASARADLEQAKRGKEDALKALDDLQEEARRKNVPPGWLRE
jgi:hypothetical protein